MHNMLQRTPPVVLMLARHGLVTVAVCVLITTTLTLFGMGTWDVNFVYSISIGLLSWLCIEFGRLKFSRSKEVPWPYGWRGGAVVAVGILVGFGIGTLIGQSYQKLVQPNSHLTRFDGWVLPMMITVFTTTAMSFVFYMFGKARYLQMQAAQAERQAAEARLAMLQTQLEPHMMFNTLANLRVLIATDPERAQTMLDHLIDYLRATLGSSRSTEHSLRDEFARLQDYLALMQIRMGSRLAFTLDLPESLARMNVPPLLLQPLVENSIRHGLEPQLKGGAIRVTAREIEGHNVRKIELTVSDTGYGIAEQRLADVSEPNRQHFGTSQVRERLATRYGDAATFELQPNLNHIGTLVRITFPLEPQT